MSAMKFLLLLLLTAPLYAQLPDRGNIGDIKGMSKVYVFADGDYYKAIVKNVKFVQVDRPEDAEFFLEYKTLSRTISGPTNMSLETGELMAYTYKDKRKVIAWSDSLTAGGFKGDAAGKLARRFMKANKQ